MANKLVFDLLQSKIAGAISEAQSFSTIEHDGTRGRLREIVLTKLIRPFIPPNWEVTTGFLCSSDGSDTSETQSGQEDLIIYDPSFLPAFFSDLEQSIVPVEAAIATIEVKSTVNSAAVNQAVTHADRIQSMHSLWQYEKSKTMKEGFDRDWIRWPTHNIFGLKTDLTEQGKTEWKRIQEVHKSLGHKAPLISSICVPDRCAFIHDKCKTDFTNIHYPKETNIEVLMWLVNIVDFARVSHEVRTKAMKSLNFIQYLRPS